MAKGYSFNIRKLCTPSLLYFAVSMAALVYLVLTNMSSPSVLCLGDYSCNVGSVMATLFVNLIYIIFWTFILDLLCKTGYKSFSWILVLLPILLLFIIYLTLILFYPA